MLYVTTRNNVDVFTAQRVLTVKRGPDGGLFVPYRIPHFTQEEIHSLGNKCFNANLADTLNLLFGSRMTSYDLDLSIGRYSVRLQKLAQRIMIGECWHNTDWHFSRMTNDLLRLVQAESDTQPEKRGWAEIGIRIALLFGILGELIREGYADTDKKVDIAVVSGNFDRPMAAWYARAMGLPIGNIVCCCNENAVLWDFISHGQLRTDCIAEQTAIKEADITVLDGLERLISVYGGSEEVKRYQYAQCSGSTYYVDDSLLYRLRQGIFATVGNDKRVFSTILNAYGTHRYVLDPESALTYAGLQDYRAQTGETRTAILLMEKSPQKDNDVVAKALGISKTELMKLL